MNPEGRSLEACIATLPTDPSVLLRLLEYRHSLELLAWDNCAEFVALKRALPDAQAVEARALHPSPVLAVPGSCASDGGQSTTAANAAAVSERGPRREIVGTMEYMRSARRDGEGPCLCCKDEEGDTKGHIFARGAKVEPHRGEWSGTEVKGMPDAVREACNVLAKHGERVMVTVELLPQSNERDSGS